MKEKKRESSPRKKSSQAENREKPNPRHPNRKRPKGLIQNPRYTFYLDDRGVVIYELKKEFKDE